MGQHVRTTYLGAIVTIFCLMPPGLAPADQVKGSNGAPGLELTNGAPSIDALLDQFLAALTARDEPAMHQLRVTEREYREIIIPGTVKPGQPLRTVSDVNSQFFWSMLNQKSEDVGRGILKKWGGHTYTRRGLRFTKGSRPFAAYTAHGDVRLQVEDENHDTGELWVGAIAEVAGRYKFISFYSNN
jgi:hypothetical protein